MDSHEFLYDRVGKYLNPIIKRDFVEIQGKTQPIVEGVCQKTGIEGRVIEYEERPDGQERRKIYILIDLLWVFPFHDMIQENGKVKGMRLTSGHIMAVTDTTTYTNVNFSEPLPQSVYVPKQNDILRRIVGQKCLFLAFGKKPSSVFGNSFRWSMSGQLEINGKISLGSDEIENSSVNLSQAMELTNLLPKRSAIDIRKLLVMEERTNFQHEKLLKLAQGVSHTTLRLLYEIADPEMFMAYRLWEK